jgi:hypothetical protein
LRKVLTYRIGKILAGFMAILVLVSTMGFSLDYHVCQGSIKSFAINGEAESCIEMAGLEAPEVCLETELKHSSNADQLQKKECCTNVSAFQKISGQPDVVPYQLSQTTFVCEALYTLAEKEVSYLESNKFSAKYAPPPKIGLQRYVLNQAFLI